MTQSMPIYKLMILEMLTLAREPLSASQMMAFMFKNQYATYFEVQQALSELSSTALITAKNIDHSMNYDITEKGTQTLAYYRHLIPDAFITNIQTYFADRDFAKDPGNIFASSTHRPAANGGFEVCCQIYEKLQLIFEMKLYVPDSKTAEQICFNWETKQTDLYSHLLFELTKTPS